MSHETTMVMMLQFYMVALTSKLKGYALEISRGMFMCNKYIVNSPIMVQCAKTEQGCALI